MPLEATMMIIDNSEYMRNGDYQENRFDAQMHAARRVHQAKADSNQESSIGIMTMAGKGCVHNLRRLQMISFLTITCSPEVLLTNAREIGQLNQAVHEARKKLSGTANVPTAINVAQLALKHRQNKTQKQRIIVFLGSPLEGPDTDEQSLMKLAKKLKKNNIALDIICFGDGIEEEGHSVLQNFVNAVNSGDNSYAVISICLHCSLP